MASPIVKVKRSETASAVPTLTYGELGVNITDKKIYVGNSSNTATLVVDGNASGGGGSSTAINATDDTSTTTLYPIMVGALGSVQTVKARSTATALSFNASTNVLTAGNFATPGQFQSTVATGTAPLTVSSTTLVTNLNADLLDGLNSATANTVSTIVARDGSGNFSAGTITASLTGAASLNVLKAGDTMTGQLISTRANSTADGGGQIYLNGATGNRIDFNQNGLGSPTFGTRTAGTRLVLFPNVGASAADYAFGIDSNTFWSSVPASTQYFKWYAGITNIATLFGTGQLVLGTTTLTGTASQPLQVTGGAYISTNLGVGTNNPFNGTAGAVGIDVNRGSAQIHARNIGTTNNSSVWASDENFWTLPSYKGTAIRKFGTGTTGNIFGSIPFSDLGNLIFQNTGNALIHTNNAIPLIFGTGSLEAMRISGSQNIGMGNTSPSFKADIAGDARITSTNKMRFGGTAGTTNFYIQYNSTANSLDFVAG